MDLHDTELPDPCLPGCGLLQECWEAAGMSASVPERRDDPDPAPAQAG